jgi:signal transduction histidine kinase
VNNKTKKSEDSDYIKILLRDKEISDQIINHSRSMISLIDNSYVYVKVNAAFCNAHQVINNFVEGKSLSDVWGDETFNVIIKSNVDLCLSGKTIAYEAAFNTPQYGKRHFEVVFRPLSVNNEEITHVLAETFDIDDLKQSKQTAIEKEEEFKNFETNLPIGFLRCDNKGKILHANNAFQKIMQCNDNVSVTSMNLKSFYTEEGFFELQVEQLIDSNAKTFGRIPMINSRGIEISCRLSGFMTVDNSGVPSSIDFAVEDCSRELMLENRLLQAQKLETIGALAGGIAHDFNNIMATILGYSEMLLEDLPNDSSSSEKIAKIQGAVLKARSITSQILTFSRQVEQEKIPVKVSEILRETLGFVKSSVPSNVTVKSRIMRKDAIVFADPTQLFRIFLNLMTNALQSMEEKGGELSVNLVTVEGKLIQNELNRDIVADEYVLLSFRDTGIGMDNFHVGRIFEPFFSTREVGKGSGLGLSVVHGIVSELEGEILVSSKKSKGSVFYVYLPISKEYTNISKYKKIRKKILFITGNRYESRILSLALENLGFELIYVSDRKNFNKVMVYIKERPDLVIYMSDSQKIRTEDFVEVYQSLKVKIPCILITGANRTVLEEKLLISGFIKEHLVKPVSLKEISNAIQATIK